MSKKSTAIITFPGIGNVGVIVSEYLLNNFKTKLVSKVYSDEFPAILINSKDKFKLPSLNEYQIKSDLFLYSGDAQPSTEKGVYSLSKTLVSMIKKQKINEVIAIGGIGLDREIINPKIFAICNNKSTCKNLSALGVKIAGDNVNIIFGMIGTVYGLLTSDKIKASILLSETSNQIGYTEVNGASKIINLLSKYLGFDINVKIKLTERKSKILKYSVNEVNENLKFQSHYIG